MSSISGVLRRIDPYVGAIVLTAAGAAVLPVDGTAAAGLDRMIGVAIGLLFFCYGARLSTAQALDGLRNWRLHLVIVLLTFAVCPLLGVAAAMLGSGVLPPDLCVGLVFLCALPSTVQSSITLTSLARGNMAGAICAASLSNLLGVVLTPLLVGVLSATSGVSLPIGGIRDVVLMLLLPFLLGQLLQRWVGEPVRRHRRLLGLAERGVILLAVYAAFSEGTVTGVWTQLTLVRIGVLLLFVTALLGAALLIATFAARWAGFAAEDRIPVVFCGAQKSLAAGLPMAAVLFTGQGAGLILLPLMLYHQLQLVVGAGLAKRLAVPEGAHGEVSR